MINMTGAGGWSLFIGDILCNIKYLCALRAFVVKKRITTEAQRTQRIQG